MAYSGGMAPAADRIGRTVKFLGRVQGVGFRATVADIARRFAVDGTVRNLADGSVELVAEGESAEIDRFVAEIQRRMDTHVREVRSSDQPPRGIVGFRIER